jgi:hypothetical protein
VAVASSPHRSSKAKSGDAREQSTPDIAAGYACLVFDSA